MKDQAEMTTIEINGIKMEVDLRQARRIENFRVGDPVKILLTGSSYSSPEVHAGVIVDFEAFEKLPTIVVAYVKMGYGSGGIELAYINEKSADKYELVASSSDNLLAVDRGEVLNHLQRQILAKEAELAELTARRDYFNQKFGVYFKDAKDPEFEPVA